MDEIELRDRRDDAGAGAVLSPEGAAAPEVPGYRVTRWVGRGSTASVWRARRVRDDALFALKVLDADVGEEAAREYGLLQASALDHAVSVHECLSIRGEGGPGTVLVLDWMAGGSLADVLAGRGFLSHGETVTVLAPLATALGELHRLGIVHGDPSPGNVLLDSTGRPVWADLGYARLAGVDPADGDVWGTDGYLAPEVVLGGAPTPASDVYGIGALGWLCLTGSAPGHVATRGDLTTLAPTAPRALVDVVEACLSPDPARRPGTDGLAPSIFDAATAEPLTLVVAADLTTSLTRRIRESAPRPDGELPIWERDLDVVDVPRRRWRRRPGRSGVSRSDRPGVSRPHRPGASRPQTPGGDAGRPPSWRSPGAGVTGTEWAVPSDEPGRRVRRERAGGAHAAPSATPRARSWVLTLAVAATAGVLLSLAVPWERLATADGATATSSGTASSGAGSSGAGSSGAGSSRVGSSSTAARSGTAAPGPASAASAASGGHTSGAIVLTERSAAQEQPREVVRALADARAALLTTRERDLLPAVDVPGSPAAAADEAILGELVEGGHSYRGLSFTVRSAEVRRFAGDEVVITARVDTSAYTVLGDGGGPREAQSAEPTELTLRYADGRWRIAEIARAS